ncbi:MAG: hypothetical protein COW71_00070 [Ignavibacteriales bacterium CG18_big_fil_WC_8_21_14_2_50_31_20]|nr:MAG: hypothetical protein COW71_00070 [Ignavibacteriales bacterium CG18_big_fil_WC_8_21_14_2_50_31_20]
MKNKLLNFLVIVFVFAGLNISAQQIAINMNVFKPLPEVSFAAFLTNPFLESTPRILQVSIVPQNVKVIVRGSILWKKLNENSFEELLNFTTKPFLSRNFYNDDFSSFDGIGIDDNNVSDNLLQDNLKKGKPTGTYRIIIEVYDSNMVFQSSATEDLEFTNPTQTLTIIQPEANDELDLGGILLSWTGVSGVTDYYVRANVRLSKFESFEEALKRGNPIINDKNVGPNTSVNFRNILDRELIGGEEIIVQVKGAIEGPGGQDFVYSELINFNIKGNKVSSDDGAKKFTSTIELFSNEIKKQLNENPSGQEEKDLSERLQDLLTKIANGEITFDDLTITTDGGREITYQEFQQILDYLRNNPELFTNLHFEEK